MMDVYRSDVTRLAKEYQGVPWRHMGRDRAGVDCVGLVVALWNELGYLPKPEIPPYRGQPDGTMLRYFKPYMTSISPRRIKNGSVVVFSFQGSPYHAGVVLDAERRSIIHALTSAKKVVVDMLDHDQQSRRLMCAWDFPGVKDG